MPRFGEFLLSLPAIDHEPFDAAMRTPRVNGGHIGTHLLERLELGSLGLEGLAEARPISLPHHWPLRRELASGPMSETEGPLKFDAAMARAVERMYKTPDVAGQRSQLIQGLALRSDERILDIGSGPGLLAFDLAHSVGESGAVCGLDASEAMVEIARERCAALPQAQFEVGDATALPYADGEFDAAVSTQVYEYVADIAGALSEAHRVLRPGGRLTILDTDWDSLVWHSRDRARMRRVLECWDAHLHDPHLPATLGPRLETAGFAVVRREIIPLFNAPHSPHSYSAYIAGAIQAFVAGRPEVGPELAQAWGDEQRELAAAGESFFSLNRYVFAALR